MLLLQAVTVSMPMFFTNFFQSGKHVGCSTQSSAGGEGCQQGCGACNLCVRNHWKPSQSCCPHAQETPVLNGSHGEVCPRWARCTGCVRHDVLHFLLQHARRSRQSRKFNSFYLLVMCDSIRLPNRFEFIRVECKPNVHSVSLY